MRIGFVLAEASDPEPAVNVVNIDEAFVGEGAPGKRKIRTIGPRVAGPEMSYFPALIVKFSAQFTGNIDDAATAV